MNTTTVSKAVLLLMVFAISAVFFAMVKGFLMAVLLAGICASLSQPVFNRLTRLFRGNAVAGSIGTLLVIVLLIIVPLGSLLGVVTAEAIKVGNNISPWVQNKMNNPDQISIWLQQQKFYQQIQPYEDDILVRAGEMVGLLSKFLINSLSTATAGTVHFFFMLSIMLYSMFFFLIDGAALMNRILYYLPLEDKDERRLIEKFSSVTRATLKGTAVIGGLQGGLAGLAFAAVGIPSSIFWGTIMVVLSIVPGIGTGLIWVPAAIILIAGGSVGKGVALALFCGLVVGSIDNFLRPRLVGKDTQIPDLLIFLSTLGGIVMFGILGFIIGPIVAALFVTIWEIYGVVFRDILPPPATPLPELVPNPKDSSKETPEKGALPEDD